MIVVAVEKCKRDYDLTSSHRSSSFDENGARFLLIFVGGTGFAFSVEVCAVAVRDRTGNITTSK
jgi:hypothetical protein